MRVLYVEDDRATAQAVELMLKAEGFAVYTTDLGEEGAELATRESYDCVLLDLNLPDMNGLEVLRAVRRAKVMSPVMIVTGSHDVEREVACFSAGADDFLRKPFHREVLIERLRAIIRRSKGHAENLVALGRIEVNLDLQLVKVNGAPIHLTGKEYQMVELMALRRGSVITKEAFLDHLYGGLDEPELKIVDVFICKIRKKLGPAADQLETSWGRGYRLVAEPTPTAQPIDRDANTQARGIKGRIVERLRAGDATFAELQAMDIRWASASLRGILSQLHAEGRVVNVGLPRHALYRLREAQSA
jgi:two-component system, cell cycle response regulator CtrA